MKDERGEPLVRALSEGTRKMRQEMENLSLPAPNYETAQRTSVTLYNHFEERLAPHPAYTTTFIVDSAIIYTLNTGAVRKPNHRCQFKEKTVSSRRLG